MIAPWLLGATSDGREIAIDVDRLIGSHACIVANSGGGKSGLIRRLLEVTHGHVQHIVLDIEDEFYTLREHFDYVIAGGDGGDAPASVESAPGLALAALEHGFSLIVQLNDLGPEDAPRFVGRFLDSLITAPRRLWRPLLVVLDEAQRFAPQEGSTEATHGVRALVAQGRKRGFTAVLASQRIAKIDADVRGDVNNWMLGRVGQSLDRRTMADALGFPANSAEARGLQGLPDRTFWGFGPAVSREPVLFRVTDVETTPVRPGQAKVATPPPPEALREILKGLAVAAPAPEARKGSAADVTPEWPDQRDEVERLQNDYEVLTEEVGRLTAERDHFKTGFEENRRRIELALKALGVVRLADLDDQEWADGIKSAQAPVKPAPPSAALPAPTKAAPSPETGLSGSQNQLLQSLAWWQAMGHSAPTRAQAAAIAGWRITSGHLKNVAGSLKSAGLIHYPSPGRFALTGVGAAKAPAPDTGRTLHDSVRLTLNGSQAQVFDFLRRLNGGGPITRETLARGCGWEPTSGHVKNVLGSLKTLEVIDYPERGQVALSGWLQ